MNEWQETTIGSVSELINGDRGKNYPSAEHRTTSGIPFVNATLLRDGLVRPEGNNYITEERFSSLRSGHVQVDDVLLCIRGSLGRTAIATAEVVPSAVASSLMILRSGPDLVPRYLLAYLQSPVGIAKIMASNNGVAQPNVGAEEVGRFPFLLPPRRSQEAIAGVLGSLDSLIENNRRRIGLLEQMAQAIYREWFVKFRYPGHEHATFVDSPLGPIPSDWSALPLGQFVQVQSGYAFKSKDWTETGIPVIKIQNVRGGRVDMHGCSFVPENVAQQASRFRVSRGDILVTMTGEIGAIGIVRSDHPAMLNQRVGRFCAKTGSEVALRFIAQALQQDEAKLKMIAFAHGAAQPNISPGVLHATEVVFPPSDLMKDFVEQAVGIDETIGNLLLQSEALKSIRDMLLPKLVTGQIDISSLDLDALLEGVA
jgi:type I restriction enzyme, S subunit